MTQKKNCIISRLLLLICLLAVAVSPVFARDLISVINPAMPVVSPGKDTSHEQVGDDSDENTKATVTIDTDAPTVSYNPMIFGGFVEHFHKQIYGGVFDPGSPLADEQGFRLDVIEALKELKVPVIRWPGGCFVDGYHWMDGVGENRQPKDDVVWSVLEPNTFGTHEFIELCRRLGAEPYICQNGLTDVKEMKEWVEYCNATKGRFADLRKKNGHPEPFNVRFWSVGNERVGEEYIHLVRDGSKGMKDVDPSILVSCSAAHGSGKVDPYLFKAAGEHLDYISIHQYFVGNWEKHQTPDYLSCIMLSDGPESYINGICKSLDQIGKRGKIQLAFDEWNLRSWHHPGWQNLQKVDYDDPEIVKLINARDKSLEPSLYTMADALFAASFYNACLRNADDITMANIAPLVNQTGPLYVHPKGIVKRTHFHALAMYANKLQPNTVPLKIEAEKLTQGENSIDVLDAVATVDKTGKTWSIALANRHPSKKVACTVKMKDTPLDGVYTATVLTGDSPDAYNDIGHPDRVAPKKIKLKFKKGVTDLPPHSLIIVEGKI